ncbi:MAG TPA: DNA-directed RNA polymerase subunit beta [Candidatus Marinimicrobia bacterium]|nr:DNA-directed RNA polymerase subunit beta [Candidatus Neomarinimicrobiota bacterium]MDP7216941.1 DNA-directed RNA polymerase subunit beta [Candidatus Neomarinimicrobiota bacterium]MDP7436861.1 DNA-directed RNA polymerase subunit beta [Candidatus Neomarinimicrobiota bacterium]HJL74230.1 DNA-directed RNA polymerase subunit beta [Candidatus Neomarinimicrobiota bacterium]HJM70171.1 DNA-directed RNA polymerase subunit beta [Candidatus Neomarinimicrobiota bacterium]
MGATTKRTSDRISFSQIKSFIDMPDLLSLQKDSFQEFLQEDAAEDEKVLIGLEGVFQNVFPLEDSHRNYVLEYSNYFLGLPKYTPEECIDRGVTYSVPLKVRLVLHITDEEDKNKFAQSIEQEVYFGNIPYMTEKGTFVINGAERVIVSQLQRSPGVFFDENIHPNGTKLFQARIIPFRGSWVDFTTDINDCLFAIIDRRRKFPVTMLLRALGFSTNRDIFEAFGSISSFGLSDKNVENSFGKTLVEDIIDELTGEIFYEGGTEVNQEVIDTLKDAGIKSIEVVDGNKSFSSMLLLNTMEKDPTHNTEQALSVVYQLLRSGDPPNLETAQKFIERIFFSPKKYDLGQVGRYRLNQQFNLNVSVEDTVLTMDDIIQVLKFLVDMRKGERGPDDIDHLGNRRVKTIGEQLTNQFSVALSRMLRTIFERMNLREQESITPQDLINSRVVTTVINTFFGTSQLSQFGDQTNPLAEITHKRRISSLGPGGLTRERAGFEVRDVHYTHYGRLCPIETPEGPNIGLISSLALFAIVNAHGFIEAPYRVLNKKGNSSYGSKKVKYLSADDEDRVMIAQSNTSMDKNSRLTDDVIRARIRGDFPMVPPADVNYMDVAPNQILSVAAALIPFLEHDDANRALMGSNMQRQSVPLMKPEAPIVGTGLETKVAKDSRSALASPIDGVIEYVDAEKIIIRSSEIPDELALTEHTNVIEIPLKKYHRTNQNTSQNQRPLVREKQKVKAGNIIADGASCNDGELALGRNIMVAFMPWRGYNFEDAIVISERLVKSDVFSSVHINEIDLEVRDTKRGEEELTAEIPNVSEDATRQLDERGIIRIGAKVKQGDILIGKVTPKGETDPTPEEKLLRAIFGEKAGEVKDASKTADPGIKGVVINTKLFEKKKKISKKELKESITFFQRETIAKKKSLKNERDEKLVELLKGQISSGIRDKSTGKTLIKKSTKLTIKRIKSYDLERFAQDAQWVEDKDVWKKIKTVWRSYRKEWQAIEDYMEREVFKLRVGDELQPGILQLAKVYVANKRKIQVGDKMAGRHGNKGVVATIVPEEDMPFTEDGQPIDIVLNPLGVPSRMNLGQLYETMLGWAGDVLGCRYETPAFDGATPEEVKTELKNANLPITGKATLIDGRSGEEFENSVTVGMIYMMKLSHMVEDKMHARSTGPYSLITQQPLGGKAQFGGQRFGEMECWALEAYGAAKTLQEILTVKSDDVEGRSKVYNAIVRGEDLPQFGSPESFGVLIKELQGLGLDIELE